MIRHNNILYSAKNAKGIMEATCARDRSCSIYTELFAPSAARLSLTYTLQWRFDFKASPLHQCRCSKFPRRRRRTSIAKLFQKYNFTRYTKVPVAATELIDRAAGLQDLQLRKNFRFNSKLLPHAYNLIVYICV